MNAERKLTHADCGRMGGAPMRTGSITSTNGGVLSSLHITRLKRLAEKATGRDREHLEAAAECIRILTQRNRRMGAQVGATMKRKVLNHRGLMLSGRPEDIAQDIAEVAADRTVHAYRSSRGRVRLTTAERLSASDEGKRIGTYDAGCDYRQVVEDVREALAA